MLKISILTPSFNSGQYLERAINSVLAQDYTDVEHIVVDGGSTDNTIEILKKYNHIKWISEPDQGQSDAMNKAFTMATGSIIGYLNADDWYEKNIFSRVLATFIEDPNQFMLVGDYHTIDDEQKILKKPHIEYDKLILKHRFIFPANPVCYFYRAKVQESVGPFPLDNHYAMDLWFLLEVFRKYEHNIKKVEFPFGFFFFDGQNKTSTVNHLSLAPKIIVPHLLVHQDYKRILIYLKDHFSFIINRKIRRSIGSMKKTLKGILQNNNI